LTSQPPKHPNRNTPGVITAAKHLAGQSPLERNFWMPKRAEELGVPLSTLQKMVEAEVKTTEKKERETKTEERRIEQRAEKTQRQERQQDRDRDREQRRVDKEAERQEKQERERTEKEQEEIARKLKERTKALVEVIKLPVGSHEQEIERLSKKLGEDVATLREELDQVIGLERGDAFSFEKTASWPEPVDVATVLEECITKVSRYVAMQPHQLTTVPLWVMHAWCYDHNVPVHSPMLAFTSAEPDSGKSYGAVAVGRMCPRMSLNIEITGPTLFRLVDAFKPTLVLDEADDLFVRKSDLKHIVNQSWTRGSKIPRQAKVNGIWQTVFYDPFGAKVLSLLGANLPRPTRTRCIELRMLPKRRDEKLEPFHQLDDAEFAILRQKFARLAADHAKALKTADPVIPPDLNNRAAANWKLLLAIAEVAGGAWPKRAREAAERLSRSGHQPSDGVKLLAATRVIIVALAKTGVKLITSEALTAELNKDPTGIWCEYNHGGPITQRQVAYLLAPYGIEPGTVHPTQRSWDSQKGYKFAQFEDPFARYLPDDPNIRTFAPEPKPPSPKKPPTRRKK
jgi:putative DNA primase/helicase